MRSLSGQRRLACTAQRPIILTDVQDNPGAGSNSDTNGMLRALLRNDAEHAAIGLIVDPPAIRKIHAAGVGQRIRLGLGGNAGLPDDQPFEAEFLIEAVSDGKFKATGPYYRGVHLDVDPAACLHIDGVRIVVSSFKVQTADQAMFRFAGIEPAEQAILVVKSAVHFRADFTPIAQEIIVAAAPGSMPMIIQQLPWKNLPAGLRQAPLRPSLPASGSLIRASAHAPAGQRPRRLGQDQKPRRASRIGRSGDAS